MACAAEPEPLGHLVTVVDDGSFSGSASAGPGARGEGVALAVRRGGAAAMASSTGRAAVTWAISSGVTSSSRRASQASRRRGCGRAGAAALAVTGPG